MNPSPTFHIDAIVAPVLALLQGRVSIVGVWQAVPGQCAVAEDQDAVTIITIEVVVHGPIHNRIACILLISISNQQHL